MGARYIFRINRCGALQPAAAVCSSCEPGYWEDVKAEHMASVTLASFVSITSLAPFHHDPHRHRRRRFVAVVLVVVFDDVIVIVVVGFVVIVVSSSSSSSSSASP